MAREMKELKVWECQHCKQLFRTPDNHNCKFDPEKRNCFTCKHHKGFKDSENGILTDFGSYYPLVQQCEYSGEEIDEVSLDELKWDNYNLQCRKWEKKATGRK